MAELTISEFARMGGKARAAKLSKQERIEAARKAGQGNKGRKRKSSDKLPS